MRKKRASLEKMQRKFGYLFTLPFLIGAIFFVIYPVLLSIRFSLSDVTVGVAGYELSFTGISNFRYLLFEENTFNRTTLDTIRNMLINVPVVVIFSFFIASMLNQEFRGRTFARAILFLPIITSSNIVMRLMTRETVASSMAESSTATSTATDFSAAFAGHLSQLDIGTGVTDLLVSTVNNISTVLAMSAIPIIIFLAGLQSISPSIYEASYVEGATKWEVFWKISLPMISPMLLVVIVYSIIDSFSSSDNGVISMVHRLCFDRVQFGVGCAAAWIYLIFVFVILAAVYLVINRFIFYYND